MKVYFSKDADKQYNHLAPSEKKKINRKIAEIQENTTAGKKLTGEFEGFRSIRAWPYRITYKINQELTCIEVAIIKTRGQVYKKKR